MSVWSRDFSLRSGWMLIIVWHEWWDYHKKSGQDFFKHCSDEWSDIKEENLLVGLSTMLFYLFWSWDIWCLNRASFSLGWFPGQMLKAPLLCSLLIVRTGVKTGSRVGKIICKKNLKNKIFFLKLKKGLIIWFKLLTLIHF